LCVTYSDYLAVPTIIIATYKLLACVNKVKQEIYYFASDISSKGAQTGL
jgi:hypothetical protein